MVVAPPLMVRPVAPVPPPMVEDALERSPARSGLVLNTALPVPVSSVSAVLRFAEVNDPSDAALPTEVTIPVRFAFVVTFPAVKLAPVPVMFVPTSVEGVPRFGVVSTGEVAKTSAPVPVSSVTAEIRFALEGVPRKVAIPVPSPETPVLIGRPVEVVRGRVSRCMSHQSWLMQSLPHYRSW